MLDKISNQKNITNDLEKCYSKYSSKNKPKIGVKKNEIRTKYRSKKQDEKINQKQELKTRRGNKLNIEVKKKR